MFLIILWLSHNMLTLKHIQISSFKPKFLTANELFSKCASFSLYWTQLFLLPLQSCTESYCWLTEASCIICLDKNQYSNTRLDFAKDKCIDHSFFPIFEFPAEPVAISQWVQSMLGATILYTFIHF